MITTTVSNGTAVISMTEEELHSIADELLRVRMKATIYSPTLFDLISSFPLGPVSQIAEEIRE